MKSVLLVNMGGSESAKEVKFFLKKMFLDRNILPAPLPVRFMLSMLISNLRNKSSWSKYQLIGGSDVKESIRKIASSLEEKLEQEYTVETALLYSKDSPEKKLQTLVDTGSKEITVIPLFPHASICTNGRIKELSENLTKTYPDVKIKICENIYREDSFLEFWKQLIQNHIEDNSLSKPFLLFTAHSIPQTFIDKGDTYQESVIENATQIADSLDLEFDVGFQSRLGRAKWLEPDTKELINIYKNEKEVVLIPLSFICENLETKYDLDHDIIPYAEKELDMKNISRVNLPIIDDNLVNALINAIGSK